MKNLVIACAALSILALAACGDDRPDTSEKVRANQKAAGEAEKTFDKENPADPGQFQK